MNKEGGGLGSLRQIDDIEIRLLTLYEGPDPRNAVNSILGDISGDIV